MNTPLVHAFFVGRALAEASIEQVEKTLTNAFSELGKFDAEQRERLRLFTQEVMERANRDFALYTTPQTTTWTSVTVGTAPGEDLQATIDDLRAEIAQLRAELQRYRTRSV